MKTTRLALFLLAALSDRALALEPELEPNSMSGSMSWACWRIYDDPPVAVPIMATLPGGKPHESMTRIMRQTPLKTARALRKLELHGARAFCVDYEGGAQVRQSYLELVAIATAAAQDELREFSARNASWEVTWETMPLSKLEKEMQGVALKPGKLSGVCRPPAVSSVVFVLAEGQAADETEKKAFAKLTEEGRALRASLAEVSVDVAELFEALEGHGCIPAARAFVRMTETQRWNYLQHRDKELGVLLRGRLRWQPLPADQP